MAYVLGSQKNTNHGLEKLSVPTWDGSRKSYTTWRMSLTIGWKSTNRTKTKNCKGSEMHDKKNSFWDRSSKTQLNHRTLPGMENSWHRIQRSKKINGWAVEGNYKSQTSKERFNITFSQPQFLDLWTIWSKTVARSLMPQKRHSSCLSFYQN